MRIDPRLLWSAAVVWSVLINGCGVTKPRPVVRYYTLSLAIPEVPAGMATSSLAVRSFVARDPYDQTRMVYRLSPYQLDFYNYHRWAFSPAQQVAEWTRRYLRRSGLFARVFPTPDASADFILGGVVRQFEEIDQEQVWEAALSIDFWLLRSEQRTPFWFQSYTATRRAAKRTPEAIAEAMSQNLETILAQLAVDLAPVVAASSPS